jgi:hypothetical protein
MPVTIVAFKMSSVRAADGGGFVVTDGMGTWRDTAVISRTDVPILDSNGSATGTFRVLRTSKVAFAGTIECADGLRESRTVRNEHIVPFETLSAVTFTLHNVTLIGKRGAQDASLTGDMYLEGSIVGTGDVNTASGLSTRYDLAIVGGTGQLAGIRGRLLSTGQTTTSSNLQGYSIAAIIGGENGK